MLHLYTDASPNGFKATIALEELGLPYELHHVRLSAGENQTAEFLALNPHGRIPVLADDESGVVLFESAAILLYLADKSGQLIPAEPASRWSVIVWLAFASSTIGPAFGSRVQFELFEAEKLHAPIQRFRKLTRDAVDVLDRRLATSKFIAGPDFSVADIAIFGWLHIAQIVGFDFSAFAHLARWHKTVAARPAVQRGILLPEPATGA